MIPGPAPHPPYTVAPCRPEQAEEYVATHVEVMCATYGDLPSGPAFVAARRSEVPERVETLLDHLAGAADAVAADRPPFRRHVVGMDKRGRIVGVASGGLGIEPWEQGWDPPIPPPATTWCLSHLYLRPEAHGTGLAAALMQAALAGAPAAYLWVYPVNPRAVAFYRRHGFAHDGTVVRAGPDWGNTDIARMVHPALPPL